MDFDDLPLKKSDELDALEKQDLSTLGAEELEDRITRLETEIERSTLEKAKRSDSLKAAEALFS